MGGAFITLDSESNSDSNEFLEEGSSDASEATILINGNRMNPFENSATGNMNNYENGNLELQKGNSSQMAQNSNPLIVISDSDPDSKDRAMDLTSSDEASSQTSIQNFSTDDDREESDSGSSLEQSETGINIGRPFLIRHIIGRNNYDPELINFADIEPFTNESIPQKLAPYIEIPPFAKVKSCFNYTNPKVSRNWASEDECIQKLFNSFQSISVRPCFDELELDNFEIYDEYFEYTNLSDLQEATVKKILYIDGIVKYKDKGIECRKIKVSQFSISGYGRDIAELVFFLPSETYLNVWYKLGRPAKEYSQIFRAFCWKARLAKYVFDWKEEESDLCLLDFKIDFYKWVFNQWAEETNFHDWIFNMNGKTDFRQVIVACSQFLWNQAHNLDKALTTLMLFKGNTILLKRVIMAKVRYFDVNRVQDYSNGAYTLSSFNQDIWGEKTIVTPTIHRWFEDLYPDHLHVIGEIIRRPLFWKIFMLIWSFLGDPSLKIIGKLDDDLNPEVSKIDHFRNSPLFQDEIIDQKGSFKRVTIGNVTISVGDTVELYPNPLYQWGEHDQKWICPCDGKLSQYGTFRLLWLYTKSQTFLSGLKKDFHLQAKRELFLTKHCECANLQILTNIKRKVHVNFGASSCSANPDSYFCEYFYHHQEGNFLSITAQILNGLNISSICGCSAPLFHSEWIEFFENFNVGNCILIKAQPEDPTKFYTILCIEEILVEKRTVKLRRFFRRFEVDRKRGGPPNFPINELLYSNYIFEYRDIKWQASPCHVEYLPFGTKPLPPNIQHRGAGNHYDFRSKEIKHIKSPEIEAAFPKYSDKVLKIQKLKCLDLFCGGGSLGRRFENSGYVDCRWAVDKFHAAIETYQQNSTNKNTIIMHESVNSILEDAILCDGKSSAPKKGEVDLILAGSPCQGFSKLNRFRKGHTSQANNSLVASLASFVDYYRPRYFLLENVVSIMQEEVFVRLLACLLEIGYQTKFGVISAEHLGCPQTRRRVFLWGAAKKKLGRSERNQHTTFPYTTVYEGIGDLPPLDTGIYWYPEFADHQTIATTQRDKEILRRIPIEAGGDYFLALKRGLIPDNFRLDNVQKLPRKQYCARVDADGVFPTIVTSLKTSSYNPQFVHYDQPRVISVREAARGQGFLDSDIIVGTIHEQYKIIGNSVPQNIAFALGLQLGRALNDSKRHSALKNILK
ncbi:hypothetical protein G9A89_014285 [Geosiphon pyriformis]|nr:hypothetical protein G9A89_014285 [Geosiphon pyriformis]